VKTDESQQAGIVQKLSDQALKGLLYAVAGLILYLSSMVAAAVTGGIGLILVIFPAMLLLWWAVWTIYCIIRGMQAINRNQPIS
ncbi:hypothetical protein, partial [Novacetimonas hansenii]|uniref:hypothetical protein n=2 Tax=Novacetimonas hansenii TaxID=436 RepID=UPI002231A499